MFGCDVIVHVGVHLAGKKALMAVKELRALLVKYHLAQSASVHLVTALGMNAARVDLHALVIRASETAVVTLQADRWLVQLLTHLHLLPQRTDCAVRQHCCNRAERSHSRGRTLSRAAHWQS